LQEKTFKVQEAIKKVEIETEEAEKQRLVVEKDSAVAQGKAEAAAAIENTCTEKLSVAEPE